MLRQILSLIITDHNGNRHTKLPRVSSALPGGHRHTKLDPVRDRAGDQACETPGLVAFRKFGNPLSRPVGPIKTGEDHTRRRPGCPSSRWLRLGRTRHAKNTSGCTSLARRGRKFAPLTRGGQYACPRRRRLVLLSRKPSNNAQVRKTTRVIQVWTLGTAADAGYTIGTHWPVD